MVRAQLTESELCLMRYNALTYNGRNTQDKILIFNLLKHLPMSRLYDLQPFYRNLGDDFSNHLDVLLFGLRKDMEETFVHGIRLGEENAYETNIPILSVRYKVADDRKSVELIFKVNRRVRRNRSNLEIALMGYSDTQIRLFFKAYLLEIFSKSMFQIYTKVDELKFAKETRENGICIKMSLESADASRTLILTRKQLQSPVPVA